MKKAIFLLLAASLLAAGGRASAEPGPELLRRQWDARWIELPGSDPCAYGAYIFRKVITLDEAPGSFPVLVSADNRYKLFVNGELVSLGPARCDIEHWTYEEVDLAPELKAGGNVIAALVWNEGPRHAEAQFTLRTAFIMQGADKTSEIVNTGDTWKCAQDFSRGVSTAGSVRGYSVVSPDEQIDMSRRIIGWEDISFDDSGWQNAAAISRGTPKQTVGIDCGKTWRLVPSALPQMEMSAQRFGSVRRSENIDIPSAFPAGQGGMTIPARTKASFLLDNEVLTNAYPTIQLSGGKGARLTLCYAEAPVGERFSKGDRDEIDGKRIFGRTDVILADGSEGQEYTSLFWRTFRYVEVTVETAEEALRIDDIYSTFTGYPFEMNARLDTDDAMMQDILSTGWRTARLCAVETYMDCPYYEQLQYGGDTRIQALISLYNSGDHRLMRNMLEFIDNSRQPEGITQSRYPSVNPQIIPTYSLCWIWMLHDYMMYVDDPAFVAAKLPGERMILGYFDRYTDGGGSIRDLPNWTFVDWTAGFMRGMSPTGSDGGSAVLDLHLLLSWQKAAELEDEFGMDGYASLYRERAERLRKTILDRYWDSGKKLFADTADKDCWSQHAQALAILCGLVEGDDARELALRIQDDSTLTQASLYFKYYTHEAMAKAGLGDNYMSWLDVWRRNLELGMTTWGETSDVERTRSDCHAWGASPNIEFFRTILGIDSAAPGFKEIVIAPRLGGIKEIGGSMPHPDGAIEVHYRNGRRLKAEITLPEGTCGHFVWKGNSVGLHEGTNNLTL